MAKVILIWIKICGFQEIFYYKNFFNFSLKKRYKIKYWKAAKYLLKLYAENMNF